MIKLGVVKEGQTPSVLSGKRSEVVDPNNIEAKCKGEKLYSTQKLASSIDSLNRDEKEKKIGNINQ